MSTEGAAVATASQRHNAINQIADSIDDLTGSGAPPSSIEAVFGRDVFSERVMRQRLPKDVFQSLQKTIKFGAWVDSQGQKIEKLYNTEKRERGLECVDIGAVYHSPRKLACYPDRKLPDPSYTMKGWVEATVKANQAQ